MILCKWTYPQVKLRIITYSQIYSHYPQVKYTQNASFDKIEQKSLNLKLMYFKLKFIYKVVKFIEDKLWIKSMHIIIIKNCWVTNKYF